MCGCGFHISEVRSVWILLLAATGMSLVLVTKLISADDNYLSAWYTDYMSHTNPRPPSYKSRYSLKSESNETTATRSLPLYPAPYRFVDPPYRGTNIRQPGDIHVERDVCVEDGGNGTSRIVIYNTPREWQHHAKIVTHSFNPWQSNVTWSVERRPGPPPAQLTRATAPAFFTSQKQPQYKNLFHVFEDGFRGWFSLLVATGRLGQPEGNYFFLNLCNEDYVQPEPKFFEFFYKMSPNLTYMGCPKRPIHGTNMCFPHGVFGFSRRLEADRHHFVTTLKKSYGVTDSACGGRPKILLIKREARVIGNIDELAAAIRAIPAVGSNTDVEVRSFTNMTIKDQMQLIHCTNVLLGMHGAGMEWLQFLPASSAVIEMLWKNYIADQYGGPMARRRNIIGRRFLDYTNITFDWTTFSMQNDIKKPLTEEEKRQYVLDINSGKYMQYVTWNPWKWAIGTFNATSLAHMVEDVVKILERRFGVPFRTNITTATLPGS